jgi:transcriptional regulator with XRE-family HTH domain
MSATTGQSSNSAEAIGERIRRLRLERGLSLRAAACSGVSAAYIHRLEHGDRQPSIKALRVLAAKLGTSVEYLETGRDADTARQRELRIAGLELELRLSDDTEAVETALRELLLDALDSDDTCAARRTRTALGLTAAQRGSHNEAVGLLEGAIADPEVTPLTHPDVFAQLGRSYSESGRPARAIELFRRCLQDATEVGPAGASAQVRFATYLSYALSDAGDIVGAEHAVADAIERAGDAIDPYSQVRLYWSQARLATISGRTSFALQQISRAIALLEATEDSLSLGRAHLLRGEILLTDSRLDDADEQFQRASRLLKVGGDALHRAALRSERAKLAARRNDGVTAVLLAREALVILDGESPAEQGRARWALAEGLAACGDTAAALAEFARAEPLIAREGRYLRQLWRAWAHVLRDAGRLEEALNLLDRAASDTELADARSNA